MADIARPTRQELAAELRDVVHDLPALVTAVQRPRIGRLGFVGAVAYAYSYVFITSTVVCALIAGISNYAALVKAFGAWMTVHGLIMPGAGSPWHPANTPDTSTRRDGTFRSVGSKASGGQWLQDSPRSDCQS